MEINVLIEEGIDVNLSDEWMQEIVGKVLSPADLPQNIEISLVITGQERIRDLNLKYRGLDNPTDVLSFSMEENREDEATAFIGPPDGLLHLGEVIISFPQALIQASENKHSIQREMAILIIHGVLHILGYDHEKDEMAAAMQAKEIQILASLKVD